jgi:pimeloyl-ACP methyl ester carboxylesterase
LTEQVLLVPGLWMPGAAMALLAARLGASGYSTRVFAYRGRSPFDANVERLARFARAVLSGGPPVHFLGHSLGGLLILEMLCRHAEVQARSAVLLGAPVRGCYAGRRFALAGVGRWMMGDCRPLWEERGASWKRPEPLGVIAGTAPIGLGRVLGRLPGANDGVVCVAETAVDGMRAQAFVPLGHSSLIVSGRVASLAARFFARGGFQ